MAKCKYCGKPAGFLRRYHPECEARHSNAFSVIPEFFGKVIDSTITAQRFSELLQAASRESFVSSGELKELCRKGFSNAMSTILDQRPMTPAELKRIGELADALGANLPNGLELDEYLAKVSVVSELGEGRIPDYVAVAGPVPVEFDPDEVVLWIFNEATMFRAKRAQAKKPSAMPMVINGQYVAPSAIEKSHFPHNRFTEEGTGDLMVTNHNIHFLRGTKSRLSMPVSHIKTVHAYAEGITLTSDQEADSSRTFLLEDSWFAGHMLYRLSALARGHLPAEPVA